MPRSFDEALVAVDMNDDSSASDDRLEQLLARGGRVVVVGPEGGIGDAELATLVADPITFTGAAVAQTQAVCRQVAAVVERHPAAASYQPGAIL